MFKQLTQKTRYFQTQQKQQKRQNKLIQQCQKVIKQLKTQLQYALQQNIQKDKIIKLLTQQKQFYQKQFHTKDQKIYPKLKDQLHSNQSLINALKQYNKQLTQKNIFLQEQNNSLLNKCKQKDQLLKLTQQNLIQMEQDKIRLNKQFQQAFKCVKKKLFQLRQQKYDSDKVNHDKQLKRRAISRQGYNKQNLNNQKRKNSNHLTNKMKDTSKVEQLLRQIDQKILNYDFLDMIQSKQIRRQIKNYDISQQNKQNIYQNANQKLFNKDQIKNKKVPILKLSQLTLKQQSF